MRNQFIYTESVTIPPKGGDAAGAEPKIIEKKNSFNVDMVIRSITMDDGGLLILMDDLHERFQDVPSINRNGKKTVKRERDTFQSEIRLSVEDAERFFTITDINKTDND